MSPDGMTSFSSLGGMGGGWTGALSSVASTVSSVAGNIGASRGYNAAADATVRAGKLEAFQTMQRGFKLAGRARAVAGAQGTTNEGSPLDAELEIIQNANTEAVAKKYAANVEAYYQRQQGLAALYKTPQALLDAIEKGTVDPKLLNQGNVDPSLWSTLETMAPGGSPD